MATSDDKVLNRDFDISVNTGTVETPNWQKIGGLDNDGIEWSPSTEEVDFQDADDGGWAKPVPFGRGVVVTLKGSRIEDMDDGSRDLGQAAVEAADGEMGAGAMLQFRIDSPAASGADFITFMASVMNVAPFGGADKATWTAELHVYGAPTRS